MELPPIFLVFVQFDQKKELPFIVSLYLNHVCILKYRVRSVNLKVCNALQNKLVHSAAQMCFSLDFTKSHRAGGGGGAMIPPRYPFRSV